MRYEVENQLSFYCMSVVHNMEYAALKVQ